MRDFRLFFGLAATAAIAIIPWACSAGGSSGGSNNGTGGTGNLPVGGAGGQGGSLLGCGSCLENQYQLCDENGNFTTQEDCGNQVCVTDRGCLDCVPGTTTCVGNDLHECTDAGEPGAYVDTCDASSGYICHGGTCTTECDALADSPSNVGCEFWVVDLPNTRGVDDASQGQFGVVISNVGQATASVVIEQNNSLPGEAPVISTVDYFTVDPNQLRQYPLPRREVTGWEPGQPDIPGPPMTWLSSNAYRITSTSPLIVYQFNNFENDFSNDASLLLPRSGLGSLYITLGYFTANPVALDIGPAIAGIPDHNSVTIVGITSGTTVDVKVAHDIMGDNVHGIPMALAGDTVSVLLNEFDVLNLASYCSSMICTSDLTGTIVSASHPVAVFSSGERAIGPAYDSETNTPPAPPGYVPDDLCCTDHIEEQMFPITSMGRKFVVTRSPLRSTQSSYREPDVLRFLGVAETATVTTNLPPPDDSFTLAPGELRETWTTQDFVLETSEPILIGQILVSQAFTEDYTGDPALTIFPPIDQYRIHYVFLVPNSWDSNYVVIANPVGNDVLLDGATPASCVTEPAGTIDGVEYEAMRCPVSEGTHVLDGVEPFGITVYGYGNVGSYAFTGGADVQPIYEPPPVL